MSFLLRIMCQNQTTFSRFAINEQLSGPSMQGTMLSTILKLTCGSFSDLLSFLLVTISCSCFKIVPFVSFHFKQLFYDRLRCSGRGMGFWPRVCPHSRLLLCGSNSLFLALDLLHIKGSLTANTEGLGGEAVGQILSWKIINCIHIAKHTHLTAIRRVLLPSPLFHSRISRRDLCYGLRRRLQFQLPSPPGSKALALAPPPAVQNQRL